MPKRKKIISSKKELRESLRDSSDSQSFVFPWLSGIMTRILSPKKMADQSTAAAQAKEVKEKIPKMEVVKTSSESFVNESIDKQKINSDFEVKQQKLSAEVWSEKKGGAKKGVEKKDKEKSMFDFVVKKGGLSENQEVVDEFYTTFNDEEKLGKKITEYEKLQKDSKWLSKVFGKETSGNSDAREKMDVIIDKYVSDEREKTKEGTEQWKMKTFEEIMGKDDLSFLQKLWLRITHPVEYIKYRAVQKKAKYLRFGKSADRFADKIENTKDKGVETVEYGKQMFKQTKEEQRKVFTHLKIAKLEKRETAQAFSKFQKKWGSDMKNANMNMAKWGPEKYACKMTELSQKGVRDVSKMGPEAIKAVGAGKVPGMKLGRVGTASFISVGVITMKEALRSRSFGEFSAKVTETSWLLSAAELLPIVGTIRSAGRLNDNSLGTSKGMRWAELGINVGLDIFTLATLGTGAGVAAGARAMLKGGTKVATKVGTRALAKKVGKELLEEGTEMVVKKGAKRQTMKVSDKLIAESLAKSGGKMVKKSSLTLLKTTLRKTPAKGWKKIWGHMPWKQAGYEGVTEGASWSWDKFGPKNQTIAQAAVNVGMKKVLTTNQARVVNMVRGGISKAA